VGGVGRTSPGTAAVGDRSALHCRNEGRLEVKQVTGEVWHAVGKKRKLVKSNTFKYYHRDCDYSVNILQYFMLFYKKCSEII